jgi:hypothetical protein
MATLRTAALNLLRLAGFRSIRSGMQAVMRDITALLVMVRRQPQPDDCYGFGSALLIPRGTLLAGMLVLQLYLKFEAAK